MNTGAHAVSGSALAQARERYLSNRTFALIVGGSATLLAFVLAGAAIPAFLDADSVEAAIALLTDVGAVAFGLLSASVLLLVAFRFQKGNPLRSIWMLLGIGIGLYAIGDVIWTVLEVKAGFSEVPYPSAADAAYVLMYVFLGLGLYKAVRAFRRVTFAESALAAEIILMLIAAIAMYVFVVAPILVDGTVGLPQKVLGVFYPIGDVIVLLGPAVFIAFVASSIGRAQTMRHWWVLAAGLGVMSASDLAFTWLDWTGRYYSGHPVDYAWMLSLLLIAVAGSLAADVARAPASRSPAARPASGAA